MLKLYYKFFSLNSTKSILISALLTFLCGNGYGQITSSPIIHNYNVKDHAGSMSNFSIVQDKQGVLYFGNLKGVIKFNGNEWKLLEATGGKAVFDLVVTEGNSVLVGSYGELGYYTIDGLGKERYTLLADSAISNNLSYKISSINESIFIIGSNEIIHFIGNELQAIIPVSIEFAGESYFVHKEQLYILDKELGLCVLKENRLVTVTHNQLITNERIISHTSIGNTTFLLCRSGKIIAYDETFKEYPIMNSSLSDKLEANIPICIDINKNEGSYNIAIGTQKNGIYYIQNHELQYNINQFNGLVNNDIRDVYFSGNVLWASTQNGISRIDGLDKWKFWNPNNQDIGLIWEMRKYNNALYVSTTKGAYKIDNDVINRIGNSVNRSYNFFTIKNNLYLNNINAINKINSDSISKIFDLDRPNLAHTIDNERSLVISYDGIFLITFSDSGSISSSKKISEISGMSFSGTMHNDDFWFTIVNSGIYKLTLNEDKYEISTFTNVNGLPSNSDYEVFVYDNDLLVSTIKGFYVLNATHIQDTLNLFEPYKRIVTDSTEVYYPVVGANNNLWYASKGNDNVEIIKKAILENDSIYVSAPLQAINNQGVTKILPDPDEPEIIWISTSQGLYRYKDSDKKGNKTIYNTVFSYIYNSDSIIFNGSFGDNSFPLSKIVSTQPESFKPTFDYDNNNIAFSYSSTNYESPELTHYSYYLEGYDDNWSIWSTATSKEYTNLNNGKYKFHVKSKNLNSIVGKTAIYEFTILPPWYRELWAAVLFAIIGVISVWLIVFVYTHRLRNNRRYLTSMVTKKTQELFIQKEEIETQNKALVSQKIQIESVNSKLKELNSTKDKLFSIISHDLKSPLNSLTAFSNLLIKHAKSMTTEEIEHLAKDFDKTLRNTYNLLVNLLEWSRSQSDNIDLKPSPINLSEIIYESIDLLESQANEKVISITTSLYTKDRALADLNSIKMVLRNLLSNAIKFTHPNGHIEISVKKDKNMLIISVVDSGIGISKEILGMLFKIESKYSTEGTAKEKGTGLGLILCKEFVEKNRGKLWVESDEEKGSTFYFSLPSK